MECSNQYLPQCDLHSSKSDVKGGGGERHTILSMTYKMASYFRGKNSFQNVTPCNLLEIYQNPDKNAAFNFMAYYILRYNFSYSPP